MNEPGQLVAAVLGHRQVLREHGRLTLGRNEVHRTEAPITEGGERVDRHLCTAGLFALCLAGERHSSHEGEADDRAEALHTLLIVARPQAVAVAVGVGSLPLGIVAQVGGVVTDDNTAEPDLRRAGRALAELYVNEPTDCLPGELRFPIAVLVSGLAGDLDQGVGEWLLIGLNLSKCLLVGGEVLYFGLVAELILAGRFLFDCLLNAGRGSHGLNRRSLNHSGQFLCHMFLMRLSRRSCT